MPFTRRTTTALPAAEPENVPSTRQRRSSTILALAAATAATTASPEQENVAYYAPETPVQNDLQGAHRASLSNLRESAWTDEQLIEFVTKFEGFFNPGKSTKEKYKAFLVSDDAKELLAMRSGLTVKGLRSKLDSTKSKYQEAKGRLGVSGASRCLGGRGQLSEGLYAVLDGLWRHVPHCAVPASDIGSMAGGMAMEDDNGALTSLARVASEAAAATAAAAAATAAGVPLLLPPPRLAPVVAFAPPRTAAALAGTASAFAPPPPTAAIAPATQPAVRRKRRGGGKHPKQPKQPKQPRVLPDAVQRVGTHPLGLSGASSSSSIPPRLPNSGLMVAFRDETMSEESDDDDGSGYVYGEEGDTVVSDGGRGSSNIGRGSSSSSSSGSSSGGGGGDGSGGGRGSNRVVYSLSSDEDDDDDDDDEDEDDDADDQLLMNAAAASTGISGRGGARQKNPTQGSKAAAARIGKNKAERAAAHASKKANAALDTMTRCVEKLTGGGEATSKHSILLKEVEEINRLKELGVYSEQEKDDAIAEAKKKYK